MFLHAVLTFGFLIFSDFWQLHLPKMDFVLILLKFDEETATVSVFFRKPLIFLVT
jgi:hypothetical protein